MTRTVTPAELRELARGSTVVDVPTAARALGIGTGLAYRLVAAGEFPTRVIRVGRLLKVPVSELLRSLGLEEAS